MKTRFAFLRMALLAAVFVPAVPAQEDGITWLTSYSAAIKEAKRTGKPIFLEFRCEP